MRPSPILSAELEHLPLAPVFSWRPLQRHGDTGAISRVCVHLRNPEFFHLSFSGCVGFWPPCTSSATLTLAVPLWSLCILHSSFSVFLPRVKLWELCGRWVRPLKSATSWACSTPSRMQMARKMGRVRGTATAQETQVSTVAADGEDTVWVHLLSYFKTNSNNSTLTLITFFPFVLFLSVLALR